MEISEDLSNQIKEICDEGDVLIEMGEFGDAFENFKEALDLIPEPRLASWLDLEMFILNLVALSKLNKFSLTPCIVLVLLATHTFILG